MENGKLMSGRISRVNTDIGARMDKLGVPLFKGVKIATPSGVNFWGLFLLYMNVLIEDRCAGQSPEIGSLRSQQFPPL